MGTSINEEIRAANGVYHIQTEYYKTSGKIVTNIFKDGMIVKRLEKELNDKDNIDDQVKAFHAFVIKKITGKFESMENSKPNGKGVFHLIEKTLRRISGKS